MSLAGEPLLYPEINQLIHEFKRKDFTTFLVSNGENPEKIAALEEEEPTQLYVSLDAPNKETYKRVCLPQVNDGWEKLNESLELLSTLDTRKVLRITSVKDLNMNNPEEYAKIISKTIILSGMDAGSFGQNAYFYDAAEGVLTASILLVSELCKPEERHIVSVFKIIQELLAPSNNKQQKNQFNSLMAKLPDDHKAKWFAGAALNTSEQSMASVMSTALSRLNAFLDSELETILCNDTEIDAERFCAEKSAIFIIMPEEDSSKYFMVSLIIQQLYREILAVADENGGKIKNRVVFYCDEFGTLPKIESAEMMFSASRSRRVSIVPIIQSLAQLEKNYGKEGAEIIVDNTQLTVFGGFAPNSETAQVLSKSLGTRTVMSGSVSQSKNDPSRSLQMIERPLMTADELKSLPKGTFVVTKTGFNPIQVKLKLFFKSSLEPFFFIKF